jgi:hypothetical protein
VAVGQQVIPQPATWGCSHGSGFLGNTIRNAETEMSRSNRFPNGDRQAAWAGHCFVFVGDQDLGKGQRGPAIIEAEWPKVKLSPVSAHPDAIWAVAQQLTAAQRDQGVAAAMGLLGTQYDAFAYAYFISKVIKVAYSKDLRVLFADMAKIGPICSGVVVREQEAMKVNIGPLKVAATQDPDFVCPADCLRWGLDNQWMSAAPSADWR